MTDNKTPQATCEDSKKEHIVRAGPYSWECSNPPSGKEIQEKRQKIEPWLSALMQAEHLNLLIGNGLSIAIAKQMDEAPVTMGMKCFENFGKAINAAAKESAKRTSRITPNFEDQMRAAQDLIAGMRILLHSRNIDQESIDKLNIEISTKIDEFLNSILSLERKVRAKFLDSKSNEIRRILGSFLLTFASRTPSRERLNIFTTNYDRLIEYACDYLGLRVLDRFVGQLEPVFRASRLGVDYHYNPPGIRGEPRYLEGVVRFSKLHGSIDWRKEKRTGNVEIVRSALPFGAEENHPQFNKNSGENLIIYPNPVKDIETLEYPYAELFRDFSSAVCQPNVVLFTYGYGFGDDHINRIIRDMLTIPSTHLAIISYDSADGRVHRFTNETGREDQITLLLGSHFGCIENLVKYYLPKPTIDSHTLHMFGILEKRQIGKVNKMEKKPGSEDSTGEDSSSEDSTREDLSSEDSNGEGV